MPGADQDAQVDVDLIGRQADALGDVQGGEEVVDQASRQERCTTGS